MGAAPYIIFQIISSLDTKEVTAEVIFSPRFLDLYSVWKPVPGLYKEPFLKIMCNGRSQDWIILKQVLNDPMDHEPEDIKTVSVVDLLPVIVRLHKEIKYNEKLLTMVNELRRRKVEELWFLKNYTYNGELMSELRELGTVLENSDLNARVACQLTY